MNEYYDTSLYLNGGGDYGYYESPYYEPVYYEPVYEPPVVYEPPPAPIYAPEPVYVPEPVYQPMYEPVYESAYYAEPVSYFEPVYYEPVYQPPPVFEPVPIPVSKPVPYVEPSPYIEPAPGIWSGDIYWDFFKQAPQAEPVYIEPELAKEEQVFFALPVGPEPEPLPAPTPAPMPVSTDWAFCANENQRCNFPDTREVRYGKGSTWTAPQIFTGGVDCSNAVFGDPLYGTVKECQTRVIAQPEPIPEPVIASDFWSGEISTGEKITAPEWPAEPDWPITPTPEPIVSEPVKMMDEWDYYGDAYLLNGGGGGGGYYDYGGGGGYYEPTYYEPIDYAPYEPLPLEPPVFEPVPTFEEYYGLPWFPEEVPYAPYEPSPLESPVFEPYPTSPIFGLPDLPFFPGPTFEDILVETDIFAEPSPFGAPYPIDRFGQYEVIPDLPDLPLMRLPYIPSPFDPWQTPPIIPPIEPIPPPPPAPEGPHLPPACAGGTYHPYPIGHPQQDICVPFPPAPPATQQPRPPTTTPAPSPAPAPRPPAQQTPRPPAQQQQPCPTGYYRNPQTGQCVPIPRCTTPGTVFDQRTGRCVPASQVSPLPIPTEAEDMFADLKKLPWWVWVGLAGVVVLSRGGRR